jgi:energy-converting hydrogenase Eha subunit C
MKDRFGFALKIYIYLVIMIAAYEILDIAILAGNLERISNIIGPLFYANCLVILIKAVYDSRKK